MRLEYRRPHGQHGDLWLPEANSLPGGPGGLPVVVLLHGGFWKAMYTKGLMTPFAADIIDRGWAVWNLEYRRVGTFRAGGWPDTFEDVAAGIDFVGGEGVVVGVGVVGDAGGQWRPCGWRPGGS